VLRLTSDSTPSLGITQHLHRRVMPRCTGSPRRRVAPAPHRYSPSTGFGTGPARHRAHREQRAGMEITVEDIAFGQAVDPLQIERVSMARPR